MSTTLTKEQLTSYLQDMNEKFSEKSSKKSTKKKEQAKLSSEAEIVLGDVLQYNTENRLRNVISKVGTISQKDFGKLLRLTLQDIYDDYNTDKYCKIKEVVGDDWKPFNSNVTKEVSNLIRSNFLNIIDGVF